VTDFGLARLLHDDPQLTRAGTTLGTPMYMSPEQLQDGEVDVRSDLYSLGVTLFHMLAGKPPFSGETPLALAMQHVQAPPPKLVDFRADIPKPLAQLVDRLLRKLPQERFGSPDEVLEFLRTERKDGLAEFWPEQTIPLPGAERPLNSAAPSPATLKLQARLNRARNDNRRRWLAVSAMAVMGLLFGLMGALYAQNRPRQTLFGNSENMYFGVAKQATVEKQYMLALLNQNPRNRYLWDAIPHYFPPEDSNNNRLYAGKAWLQAARQLMLQDDENDRNTATTFLRKIIVDNEMDDVVKALAWLELAVIAQDRYDEDEVDEAVSQAARIRNRLSAADDGILLQNVPKPLSEMFSADRSTPPGG
jgi:eukaryotic-like serine/threonine-protein kinase